MIRTEMCDFVSCHTSSSATSPSLVEGTTILRVAPVAVVTSHDAGMRARGASSCELHDDFHSRALIEHALDNFDGRQLRGHA
jgi:hypothetical protein